jgi:hypothetical protein
MPKDFMGNFREINNQEIEKIAQGRSSVKDALTVIESKGNLLLK